VNDLSFHNEVERANALYEQENKHYANRTRQMMWAIFILFLLVGCGAPAATPTSEILPETIVKFEIMFDGNDCIVKGPAEVPAGEYTFIFIDQSDRNAELWVANISDGKTFQDLVDLQPGPGIDYPKLEFVHYDPRISRETEELEGRRVDTCIYNLDVVGEHAIYCGSVQPNAGLWFGAPLIVK